MRATRSRFLGHSRSPLPPPADQARGRHCVPTPDCGRASLSATPAGSGWTCRCRRLTTARKHCSPTATRPRKVIPPLCPPPPLTSLPSPQLRSCAALPELPAHSSAVSASAGSRRQRETVYGVQSVPLRLLVTGLSGYFTPASVPSPDRLCPSPHGSRPSPHSSRRTPHGSHMSPSVSVRLIPVTIPSYSRLSPVSVRLPPVSHASPSAFFPSLHGSVPLRPSPSVSVHLPPVSVRLSSPHGSCPSPQSTRRLLPSPLYSSRLLPHTASLSPHDSRLFAAVRFYAPVRLCLTAWLRGRARRSVSWRIRVTVSCCRRRENGRKSMTGECQACDRRMTDGC